MDRHLTRQGALNVTSDLDRIAEVVQKNFEALGLPERIAADFCWRCDVISDAIEKRAIQNDPIHGIQVVAEDEGDDEDGSDKEAGAEWAQPAKNETGDSVEPTGEAPNWDANAIADDVGGPHKQEPDEGYMSGEFSQQENHELRDRQQSGSLPGADRTAADSLDKLSKMVAASSHMELRALSDRLKGCVAKLEASGSKGIAPLVSGAKKQIAAMDDLADDLIKLDSTGEGSPELLLAADQVMTAVGEIVPHLEMVEASAADQTSPSALLEHGQLLEDGTIAKLVSLAGQITADAMKSIKGGDKADKEASADDADDADDADADDADADKTAGYDLFAA